MAWRSNLLFCRSCYNVYFASEVKPNPMERFKYVCPNYFCAAHQELVSIDELMVKPIVQLNKKGYLTAYCCSGHNPRECDPYADNAYIAFFTPVKVCPKAGTRIKIREDLQHASDPVNRACREGSRPLKNG